MSVEGRHRRWLRELGILDRPWIILGGAPEPTLPPGLLKGRARIDINNSGLTAFRRGLGPADLTFRRAKARWDYWPEFTTRGLIWFTSTPTALLRLRLMTKHRRARVGGIMRMGKPDRAVIIDAVLGTCIDMIGDQGKPSNGVVAACYALKFGIPEVVLTGMSLHKEGHSYDALQRPRKQVEEDGFALRILAADPRISTTEPELAALTGLRLWADDSETSL